MVLQSVHKQLLLIMKLKIEKHQYHLMGGTFKRKRRIGRKERERQKHPFPFYKP